MARLCEDFASSGDLDELGALVRGFLTRGGEQIEVIARALRRGDAGAARRAAHKLTGSSETLGAARMGALADAIEDAARDGDVLAASRHLGELRGAFSLTRTALEEAIGGWTPAAD